MDSFLSRNKNVILIKKSSVEQGNLLAGKYVTFILLSYSLLERQGLYYVTAKGIGVNVENACGYVFLVTFKSFLSEIVFKIVRVKQSVLGMKFNQLIN